MPTDDNLVFPKPKLPKSAWKVMPANLLLSPSSLRWQMLRVPTAGLRTRDPLHSRDSSGSISGRCSDRS